MAHGLELVIGLGAAAGGALAEKGRLCAARPVAGTPSDEQNHCPDDPKRQEDQHGCVKQNDTNQGSGKKSGECRGDKKLSGAGSFTIHSDKTPAREKAAKDKPRLSVFGQIPTQGEERIVLFHDKGELQCQTV